MKYIQTKYINVFKSLIDNFTIVFSLIDSF